MEQHDIRQKPCLLSSDRGMTLLELLVASFLGLILISMTLSSTLANQRLFEYDLARTRLNQNLRSALDMIGADTRQAGERLPSGFPAVEIINGTDGAPDEIVLRRNMLDEVLFVCEDLAEGDTDNKIYLSSSSSGTSPACTYGGQSTSYASWSSYRANEDGEVKVYLFNLGSQEGEFINYTGESDTGASMWIERDTDPLAHDYLANVSAVYVLVEWRYKIDSSASESNLLQVIENEDTDNPINVMFDITDLQVQATMQDGTVVSSFAPGDNWALLQAIDISISGQEASARRQQISTTLSARYFPRNILSQ